MKVTGTMKVKAPPQWEAFITHNPEQETPLTYSLALASARLLRPLHAFNTWANAQFQYTPEERDHWSSYRLPNATIIDLLETENALMPPAFPGKIKADCEDYVFSKRKALAPFFGLATLVPIILDLKPRQHMVLGLQCQDHTYLLDNRTNDIRPLQRAHNPGILYCDGSWHYALTF